MHTHSYDKSAGLVDERCTAARRGLRSEARGPLGGSVAIGHTANALQVLIRTGATGITTLEAGTWAFRLAAYVHVLRRQFVLNVHMEHQAHEGTGMGVTCSVLL